MPATDIRDACECEVHDLHEFFVAWFTGTVPNDDDTWGRAREAMAPGFVLVAPSGERFERAALLDGIQGQYGTHRPGAFRIWTKKFEVCRVGADQVTIRYEEWQQRGTQELGRVSSAVLVREPRSPNGVSWLAVHETWLPGAGPGDCEAERGA